MKVFDYYAPVKDSIKGILLILALILFCIIMALVVIFIAGRPMTIGNTYRPPEVSGALLLPLQINRHDFNTKEYE